MEDLRIRPGDVPDSALLDRHHRARLLEVHELVRIDHAEARGLTAVLEKGRSDGRSRPAIIPPTKRRDEDWVAKQRSGAKDDRFHCWKPTRGGG